MSRLIQCKGVDRKRVCPKCPGTPRPILSSEFHVAWMCPVVADVRKKCGITMYKNIWLLNNVKPEDSFYFYMKGLDYNSDFITKEQCMERASNLKIVRSEWLKLCVK